MPPTHFVTAAGMVPINQLVPVHMVRSLSPGVGHGGAIPLEGLAYGMPFFVHAPHMARNGGNGGNGSDSSDGSPSRGRDDDGYGRNGRRDSKDKDKRKKRMERDPDVLAALAANSPSLEEILKTSSIHSLSQDQVGCRFLQQKLDEGGPDAATIIFSHAKYVQRRLCWERPSS
jgi:hypothetical protein